MVRDGNLLRYRWRCWPPCLQARSSHAPRSPPRRDLEFFENKIRPIFANNCYKCHSSEAPKLKGGLSLEYRETMLRGGETGPAIVPGDPEKSLIIKAVRYTDPDLQMPPKDKKLSDEQIADLVRPGSKSGAPDPRTIKVPPIDQQLGSSSIASRSIKDHWSFKPIKMPPVPDVKDNGWGQTPVDAFIFAKLADNGMKPSPLVDKRTLIRRATFDLIGVAPTMKETQDFLDDTSTNAYEKVVDRLLASPQYGERWGRYWLDTARYSDTKGDVKRASRRISAIPMHGPTGTMWCAHSTRTSPITGSSSSKSPPTSWTWAATKARWRPWVS